MGRPPTSRAARPPRRPAGGPPANVAVRAGAEVDRVTFDGDRATGVRLVDGSTIEAGVVVLCAGTYGSPAVLLRAGGGAGAGGVRQPRDPAAVGDRCG